MILILYRGADSLAFKTVIFLRFSCERGQAVRCSDVCMCVNDMFQFCPSLLSPEAPFCHRERRKRKRAVDDGKGERDIPLPIVPCALVFCRLLLFSLGYPAEPLRRREVLCRCHSHCTRQVFLARKVIIIDKCIRSLRFHS